MAAQFGITQILLLANLILMSFMLRTSFKSAGAVIEEMVNAEAKSILPVESRTSLFAAEKVFQRAPGIGSTDSGGFYFVHPREGERDFYKIGKAALPETDKVQAPGRLPGCLKDDASCTRPSCTRPECRPWGHHYDTIYQQRLGPFSRDDVEPFQFLEIGFFNGGGYDTVSGFEWNLYQC